MKRHNDQIIWIFFFILLAGGFSAAQQNLYRAPESDTPAIAVTTDNPYQHLSPLPNSDYNCAQSTIIIREGGVIDWNSINDASVTVRGSQSGKISGRIILSDDRRTLIFKPDHYFLSGEKVEVNINGGIKTVNGKFLPHFNYSFLIEPDTNVNISLQYSRNLISWNLKKSGSIQSAAGIPKIRTSILNESAIGEGKIFLSAYGVIDQSFQSNPSVSSSVLIVNNDGTLFYSKDIGSNQGAGLTDFKMQPNGLMSYPRVLNNYLWTGGAEVIHMVMDRSFAVVDSFQMGNGYKAETHDFQMLPNGHVLMMGYYLRPIDLSQIVKGSHPDAHIDGAVIQELDSEKNVVFQWRTWDYISTGSIPWNAVPGNTQQIINVFHLNSLRLDNDGNLLLGTPGMGMKVSRQTGEILWIIGGMLNQFTFSNVTQQEALGDFGGHTFQRLSNGNILVFDNSPFPWQPGYGLISSEVVEYKINEEAKTAEPVWKYKPEQIIPGWHAGSVQRLPNGNTVICWGGPPNEGNTQIPIMTEVTQSGEKVFELFYEGTDLESYRAFRFPLNDGLPNSQITKAEVFQGNTYEFKENNKIDPGISIKINALSGFGYNELIVKNYDFAPLSPGFAGKAPLVIPRRIVLSNFGITGIGVNIRFDINNWGVTDPSNTIIYYRKNEGSGVFVPLATTYNFVTGKLTADNDGFGEYILGKPDLKSQLVAPLPNAPENESKVNYKLQTKLEWSPAGYAGTYSLQVAADENFTNLLIDENSLHDALFNLPVLQLNSKYYWHVRTVNDAGESPWCETQSFTAVEPFIMIKKPDGGERWHIGLEYNIEWEDNIAEPVTISLLRNDESVKNIAATANSFYQWEVGLNLLPGGDYKIKITSTLDSTLYDISGGVFSIIDTVTSVGDEKEIPTLFTLAQNYPNPFNAETIISFTLARNNFTSLKIYNSLGQEVKALVNNIMEKGKYSVRWDASEMPSGIYFYKLISGDYIKTKKLMLLK